MVWACYISRQKPPGKSGTKNNGDIPPIIQYEAVRQLSLFLFLLLGSSLPGQELELFELFTDHAVLQRNAAHPVWGWARPNRTVRVTVDGHTVKTRTGKDGRWTVTLPAMPAGGPHSLTVTDGRTTVDLADVYYGDVYLLSGQSNMEWRLAQSDPESSRATAIADPMIRQVLVSKTGDGTPREHVQLDEAWKAGTQEEIADFSAVGSYFAHYLKAAGIDVPIGLVHASWGGSRIEPWIPVEWQGEADIISADELNNELAERKERVLAFYRESFNAEVPPPTEEAVNMRLLAADTDRSTWAKTSVPGLWEGKGYADVDGIFYYRKHFELTAEQANEDAEIHLGPIDDQDLTYINGVEVGTTDLYSQPRIYRVPAIALQAGENTLAVRVKDTGGGGGFFGNPDSLYLKTARGDISLSGEYDYRIGALQINSNSRANQTPTLLYNAMIAPLQKLPLTAVLWYQGESNASAQDAPAYAGQMRSLVGSWREQFANDTLPFYWVQLANYMAPPGGPDEPGWATLRAKQTEALDIPFSGQAIITDIGEADDIHPKNKWEVGRRLSLHALRNIYGKQLQASSPVANSLQVAEGIATIDFTETGEGLTVKMENKERYPLVKSLSIQDKSGKWHWAIGVLNGGDNTLKVINPQGTGIVAVRYAWSNNPDDANLYSVGGLPVTPFELQVK